MDSSSEIKLPDFTDEVDSSSEMKLSDFTDEITAFEAELSQLKSSFVDILISVGSKEEMEFIENSTNSLLNDYEIIPSIVQQLNANIEDLKCLCRGTILEIGQAQAQKRWSDFSYHETWQNRPLDPLQAKKINSVRKLEQEVSSQLFDLNRQHNQNWMNSFNLPEHIHRLAEARTESEFKCSSGSLPATNSCRNSKNCSAENKCAICKQGKTQSQSVKSTSQIPRPVNYPCKRKVPRQISKNSTLLQVQQPISEVGTCGNKISTLREFQCKYKSLLHESNSFEIIKEYRQETDKLTEKCISHLERQLETVLNNINNVDAKAKAAVEAHANIVIEQQRTFQNYLGHIKSQYVDMFKKPVTSIVEKCEQLFQEVNLECLLLSQYFPLYAFKEDILSIIGKNVVSIISADALYSASDALLMFIGKYMRKTKSVAMCEPNTAMANHMFDKFFKINNATGKELYSLLSRFCAEKTELVFTTVEELYDAYLNDMSFASYSFIIIDCPLKRSIQTDLLLSALREVCKKRRDLKLVLVVSPPQSPKTFVQYFSSAVSTGVFCTPNLIHPVQKVWKRSSCNDRYVQEAVETVLAIHVTKKQGDILAFLPTYSDIGKVCADLEAKFQEYFCDNIEVVPLVEDKVKEWVVTVPVSLNCKRKVFLATSFAETILFPTVAYVVDSGLSIEQEYNCRKGLEVQNLALITKERAKLRKSCAGRYRSGVCFRLYSRKSYAQDMIPCERSEVQMKNPYETVLRIYQCKLTGAEEVELIEPLSKEVEEKAISNLEAANAISNFQLTSLGRRVIMLPFSPKYSKMIVLGIQWGFTFESVLLVAYFMTKRSVFLQNNNDAEKQKDLALKKLQFLCHDSDTFTFLNIYDCWMQNGFSKDWCCQNLLDFSTLNEIKAKALEIIDIVTQRMKQNIVPSLLSGKQSDWKALQEIVFECLKDNFSVYSGHSRSGYHVRNSGSIAYLDPLSPVVYKGTLPQFVVFNDLTQSSKSFMSFVTAVPEEIVFSALDKGILPAEIQNLFNAKLEPYLIEPVGISLVKQLFLREKNAKFSSIEEKIKEQLGNDIVLEPSEDKGSITVYALRDKWHQSEEVIREILEEESENLVFEKEERIVVLKKGRSKLDVFVTWTKGAHVIKLDPLNRNSIKGQTAKFSTFDEENVSSIKRSINVTWPRRFCTGTAFISFDGTGFQIARRLSLRTIKFDDQVASIMINEFAENQLTVTGLTQIVDAKRLKKAIQEELPKDIKIKEVILCLEKPFPTTDNDIEEFNKSINECCWKFYSQNEVLDYEVHVPKPNDDARVMKASIKVNPLTPVEELAEHLNIELKINELDVTAVPYFSCTFTCSLPVFKVIEPQLMEQHSVIENALKNTSVLTGNLLDFHVDIDQNMATIKLSSDAEYVMNYLYKATQETLDGLVIDSSKIAGLHRLFTHGGHLWLRALEKQENVHIVEEYVSKRIRIYGFLQACGTASARIQEFVNDTEHEIVTPIDLSHEKHNPMLFKTVIEKYGFSLKDLIEEFDLRSADIDFRTSTLKLHGSPESVENAVKGLENLASILKSKEQDQALPFQEPCSVCHMPPRQLSIRLEYCNHLYCAECVQGLIKCTDFPILCCAENCNKELILEDIRKGLDYDEEAIDKLVTEAMNKYLSHNVLQYMYCPAPDCPMFCDKSRVSGSKWHCPLCQNDICLDCNVLYHFGYTCDIYQGSKKDADYSFKAWVRDYKPDCKSCPQCKHAIERVSGCNHMHCLRCNGYFCWACSAQFASTEDMYNHGAYCQGNQGPN